MSDLISRQQAIEAVCWACGHDCDKSEFRYGGKPEDQFILCPEHYALATLPSAQPEIVRCKDCKHFHYDMPYVIQGIPVLGHEVCDFWGDGCKTDENGFCSFAERRTDERKHE